MSIKILYFGNNLLKHGKTPTGINFLGDELAIFFCIKRFSDKRFQIPRMLHMIAGFFWNASKTNYILIDTFSGWGFYYAFLLSQLARIWKIPYIPILHGGNLPLRMKNSPFLSNLIFKYAYKIVTPSFYLYKPVSALGYSVSFIPNPINIDDFTYKERLKLRPKLIWIRSLKAIYNPKMAVHVLKRLKESYSDASLCIVGPYVDNSKTECIELAKDLGLMEDFCLTGMLSRYELKRVAAEYDIFINTTNVDNTPMSVLEAMAMGLPVVSTNVGGIPYLVENDVEGLLSPPNDHIAMANNIIRLLNDKKLATNLTKNALKKVRFFDKRRVLEQWREILKK